MKFGKKFNHPIERLSFPNSLQNLEFNYDSEFSQPIDNLPSGLKTLIMGSSFVERVDNLPDSLKKLTFLPLN